MEKNTKENGAMCSCVNCQYYGAGFHRHYWLRWVLGIMILGIVFVIGFKIGEFKGYFESEFGSPFEHHSNFYYNTKMNPGPGMMYNNSGTQGYDVQSQ